MTEPKSSTVLVVDDNAIIRRLQEAQLEALRVQLVAASGGEEALALVRSVMPDLVVLDVVMPGMDGFKVCETLKADPVTRGVPVMVVTALGKDARDRSFMAGADDFMRKPPNTLLLRARAMVHLRIRWAGLTHDDEPSAGPLLLVSEDGEMAAGLRAVLPDGGALIQARSVEQARAVLDRGPAAMVLDIALEGAVDFARELRGRPGASELPVLLLHHAEDFTVLEEEHPPVDDYLELPTSQAEVRHRVRLLLRLARAQGIHRA